ncbi:circadian clock protein KaiA [Roseofilum capinflatum]
MPSQLSICSFIRSESLGHSMDQYLDDTRHAHTRLGSEGELIEYLDQHRQQIDCLVVEQMPEILELLSKLREQKTYLPMVAIRESVENAKIFPIDSKNPEERGSIDVPDLTGMRRLYHDAILEVTTDRLQQVASVIDRAIEQFLELSTTPKSTSTQQGNAIEAIATQHSLKRQQRRLGEKLKERLGYLGVYYKRDPKNFFRRLSHEKQQDLLDCLKKDYEDIILNYFSDDEGTNAKIDDFVNIAFFADISVSQIVEIHMELMEEYSKQLQLEGRSEEILLDYRLTLIDTIAHLCEMYRRSIPRQS